MNVKYYYRLNRDSYSERWYLTITDIKTIYFYHSIVSKGKPSLIGDMLIVLLFPDLSKADLPYEITNTVIINMLKHKMHKELYIAFRDIVVEDLNQIYLANKLE